MLCLVPLYVVPSASASSASASVSESYPQTNILFAQLSVISAASEETDPLSIERSARLEDVCSTLPSVTSPFPDTTYITRESLTVSISSRSIPSLS